MKLYLVTETNHKDNTMLRSWVCNTKEEATECLRYHHRVACAYARIGKMRAPVDCTEMGFFFWTLQDGQELRYNIVETKTYTE